jgi:hypothetical protein
MTITAINIIVARAHASSRSKTVISHIYFTRTAKTTQHKHKSLTSHLSRTSCLQEEPDEHGQGKWEGKQEGKSDKTPSFADGG